MAVKIQLMKMLQEIRGLAEITTRRPAPKQPGLVLMQLRYAQRGSISLSRKTISVTVDEFPEMPHPVKITHVAGRPSPAAAATVP
jgi:hypothetical protein